MVIIKNYKVIKIFNKFPEISGKIRINFRKFPEIFRGKFPEISELTTYSFHRQCTQILINNQQYLPDASSNY